MAAACGAVPGGTAKRRRDQGKRAQARHVRWLASLLQCQAAHHTASPSPRAETLQEQQPEGERILHERILALEQCVAALQSQVQRLLHPGSENLQPPPQEEQPPVNLEDPDADGDNMDFEEVDPELHSQWLASLPDGTETTDQTLMASQVFQEEDSAEVKNLHQALGTEVGRILAEKARRTGRLDDQCNLLRQLCDAGDLPSELSAAASAALQAETKETHVGETTQGATTEAASSSWASATWTNSDPRRRSGPGRDQGRRWQGSGDAQRSWHSSSWSWAGTSKWK